jgi:N-acetylmuramoyl-L-alanine amidase
MKRFILLTTGIFLSLNSANAFEIVYPKTENYTTGAETTFFIGSETSGKALTINSQEVKLSPSGLFLYPIKLEEGENIFSISNGSEEKAYRITRTSKSKNLEAKEPQIIDYDNSFVGITNRDGVPLRSTPYDFGINRLQHLEKGIPLSIVGEYEDFYKVQLARDDYAWILKTDITSDKDTNTPTLAKIENFVYSEEANKRIFTIKLDRKVPYVLSETNGLDFVIYNVKGYPENKYEFHINKLGKDFGYKVKYKTNDELVIEVKNFPKIDKNHPLKGITITLDAGHGGDEKGAISGNNIPEKDINLAITLKLKQVLENAGANVYLTRKDDSDVSLSERVKISQKNNSDIFISIHNNALPDSLAFSDTSGTAVYYFYPQSKDLAKQVQSSMLVNLGMKDDKVRRESFAVVRNTESLAILIEVGYMMTPEDFEKLQDEEFQQKVANSIEQGLENYFNGL